MNESGKELSFESAISLCDLEDFETITDTESPTFPACHKSYR